MLKVADNAEITAELRFSRAFQRYMGVRGFMNCVVVKILETCFQYFTLKNNFLSSLAHLLELKILI